VVISVFHSRLLGGLKEFRVYISPEEFCAVYLVDRGFLQSCRNTFLDYRSFGDTGLTEARSWVDRYFRFSFSVGASLPADPYTRPHRGGNFVPSLLVSGLPLWRDYRQS
jgi:hypothetical protein